MMGTSKFFLNEDGILTIPEDLKQQITVVPNEDLIVKINDKQIQESASITGQDKVELLPGTEEDGAISVEISKDKLTAYIMLTPAIKVLPRIKVINSQSEIVINITPDLVEEYPFTIEQLEQALAENGVNFGVDNDSLLKLINNPTKDKVPVAFGTPCKPGTDETVNVLIDTENDGRPEFLPDGRVDFKQKRIASIDEGQMLAVKIPGSPGEPGVGVDGDQILPPEYKRVHLQAGEGTILQQNENAIASIERGLPSLQINQNTWFFKVNPLYTVKQVDVESGNLEFNGSVAVDKDVTEGMAVFAAGDVNVGGAAYGARIVALGDVVIGKNVLSSFINAGGMSQYLEELKSKFEIINKSLVQISELTTVLKDRSDELGKEICLGQLVVGLINKKFGNVPKVVDEISKMLVKQRFVVSSEIKNLITELEMKFRRLGWLKITSMDEVDQLQQRVLAVMNSLEVLGDDSKGNVTLTYAINSNIEAEGDVHITGKGCINTNINTKGNVIINGVFRGGTINCKGTVKVKEAGSEIGVKTVIKSSGNYIRIEKTHQNVTITSGETSRNINNTEYKTYLNNDD